MSPLEAFIASQARGFRERAEILARYGAKESAMSLQQAAEDLESAFRGWWMGELTVAEAAEEAGYSEERMRELVREGRIVGGRLGNAGPFKVRRCDLPRKAGVTIPKHLRHVADRLGIK